MSNREIIVENLAKHYPGVQAVDDISFTVNAGEIFGFLGPNGAGKSTTIKILTTLGLPTYGNARVGGYDIKCEADEVRRIAGVALQEIGLDPIMKPLELLILQGQFWQEVRRLNREIGMTIFLTTQYLEEADVLSDRIAIIDQGKLQAQGVPAQLKAGLGLEAINVIFDDRSTADRACQLLSDITDRTQIDRNTVRLYLNQAAETIPQVVSRLQQANLNPISLTLTHPTLDDVFLQVTGQRLQSQETKTEQGATSKKDTGS
ncbi:MAG: ATP-binding cassette domain-containing protein [Anaerolineales bacterium]